MSEAQLDLVGDVPQTIPEPIPDDGKTDLQRLMDKKAEDLSQKDVSEICKILRERRNQYNLDELEKATKKAAPKEPKAPKAPKVAKAKTKSDETADLLASQLGDTDILNILGDLAE